MNISVDVTAHDCHRLHAGGAHGVDVGAECSLQPTAVEAAARTGYDDAGRLTRFDPGWNPLRGGVRAPRCLPAGHGDGADRWFAVDDKCDMDRPVRRVAVVARSIEWVNDPDPFLPDAGPVVGALFGQDRVVGPHAAELGHDEPVCSGIAFVFESAPAPVEVGRVDEIDEHLAGPMGDVERHRMVVEGGRLS